MKELLDAGLLHGDCLTVTGKTVAENLTDVPKLSELGAQVLTNFKCSFGDARLCSCCFRMSSIRCQIRSPSRAIT